MAVNLANKIMLEVAPPAKRTSKESIRKIVEKIALIANENNVDYINIPEIVNENFEGIPLYKNMDPCDFALVLKNKVNAQIVVNKVIVHLLPPIFDAWLKDTIEKYQINSVVLVGGSSASIKYPGLSVTDANNRAATMNVNVGNIAIPNRASELQRLISKTQTGCSFFTTQIIFEPSHLKSLLLLYDAECKNKNLTPATFFLCFAPIGDALDIEYIKWLGADIPLNVEKKLQSDFSSSINLAQEIYHEVMNFSKQNKLSVPLSINIEPISIRNLDLAQKMLQTLAGK